MKVEWLLQHYREVWTLDTEYCFADRNSGNRPTPVCLVAHEIRSNRWLRHGSINCTADIPHSLLARNRSLSPTTRRQNRGTFVALDWPLPANILDLHTEFRCLNNGLSTIAGYSLHGALIHFGVSGIDVEEKRCAT